jgi:CxxC-x17-CxxC domain-containing protein
MKKHLKHKDDLEIPPVEPDVTSLLIKIGQHITFLEKKIDTLISRTMPKPVEMNHAPKPFQQPVRHQNFREERPRNNFRERTLFQATCADCKKQCEVPFKPSGERPVYCKECFSKRKGGGNSFKKRLDNGFGNENPAPTPHSDRPQVAQEKKAAKKKRPAVKQRKARARAS